MSIVWRPAMSVSNSFIDTEHKYLICLINTLELTLQMKDDFKATHNVLDQLMEYTREHFDHEEKLMLKVKYPQYMEHKIEHQDILANCKKISNQMLEAMKANELQQNNSEAEEPDSIKEATDQEAGEEPAKTVQEKDSSPNPVNFDTSELMKLLRDWIIDHVLTTDMKLKPYLAILGNYYDKG